MPGAITQIAYDGLPTRTTPHIILPNQQNHHALAAPQIHQAHRPQQMPQAPTLQQPPQPYTTTVVGPQTQEAKQSSQTNPSSTPALTTSKLADFASNMVYQMWHFKRPSSALSGPYTTPVPNRPSNLSPTASVQFKNFCNQVLSQTQLSESVVLLSLKYVQKLVKSGRMSTGDKGSEYRLFTVALMLANKFLDDNTFTNKTWSEVTNIPVKDLNIMELEFLDNLEFKLFVSDTEYKHWLQCLNEYTQKQHQQLASHHQRQRSTDTTSLRTVTAAAAAIQQPQDTQSWVQRQNSRLSLQQPYKQTLTTSESVHPVPTVIRMPIPRIPTQTGIGSMQHPPIGRVQPQSSYTSPSPAQQALINSYVQYGHNSNNPVNGPSNHAHHSKRHSMPTSNLLNVIDQAREQPSQPLNKVASSNGGFNGYQAIPQANVGNTAAQGHYVNIDLNTHITAHPNGNVNNKKPQFPVQALNFQHPVQAATNALPSIMKPQEPQPQTTTSSPQQNSENTSHNLTHHRSMPILNTGKTIISGPSSANYASSQNQADIPAAELPTPAHGYVVKPYLVLPQGKNNCTLTTTNDDQHKSSSSSTTIQMQSPEQSKRTPPLLHSQQQKTPQNSGASSVNFGVSSNPPTPVECPTSSQYRHIVGGSTNYGSDNIRKSRGQQLSSKKVQQPYGSIQAQQGMNVVTNGSGSFVFPLLGSNRNANISGNNDQISVKKIEEGIANDSNPPVMIAPPGLGVAGGFGAPTVSIHPSDRAIMSGARVDNLYNG